MIKSKHEIATSNDQSTAFILLNYIYSSCHRTDPYMYVHGIGFGTSINIGAGWALDQGGTGGCMLDHRVLPLLS